MSKKIAAGAQAIVLDVKVGRGAFMKTLEQARELSALMIEIGELSGRKVVGLIADMNQPLGHAVGNALEVKEAIDTLHGGGPTDFREHCLHVSSHMLAIGGRAPELSKAREMAEHAIADGSAFAKFRALVQAQGGDVSYVDHPDKLPAATRIEVIGSPRSGWLSQVDARSIGETSVLLGAGRAVKSDRIDHAVGLLIYHKVGDYIEEGAPLFSVHANDQDRAAEARERVLAAHLFSDQPVPPLPLFYQ